MAEKSKYIGELGEEFSKDFLDFLGWSKKGSWGVDIPCVSKMHKQELGKLKREHGIDAIYGYKDPYSESFHSVLVEAKAISWMTKGKPRSAKAIAKDLNEYISVVLQKAECADSSRKFKDIFDLPENWARQFILLSYFVHDGWDRKKMSEVRSKIALRKSGSEIPVYIADNTVFEDFLTARNFLQKVEDTPKNAKVEFFHPERSMRFATAFWSDHLTIDNLFSAFYVARIRNDPDERTYVMYRGEYSVQAIRLSLSALARLQILPMNNLKFVPCNNLSLYDDRHGLELLSENKLETFGREIKVEVEQPPRIMPSFKVKVK